MAGLTLTRQKSDKDQLVAAPPAFEVARVNLLPPEIEEEAKFRSLRLVLAAVVAGAVVIVILLTVWAGSGIASAQDAVAQQQAKQVVLQKQLATLSNVPATFAKVASAQNSVSSALGAEVLWSTYLADLSLTIPDGVAMQTDDHHADLADRVARRCDLVGQQRFPRFSGRLELVESPRSPSLARQSTMATWLTSSTRWPRPSTTPTRTSRSRHRC